jgi:hypothetical protein
MRGARWNVDSGRPQSVGRICIASCASALAIPACFHPTYNHPLCSQDHQCPSGLTCDLLQDVCVEPGGVTIAPDARDIDASSTTSPDAPPDARVCFGTAPFTICLASAPTTPVMLASATPVDTTTSTMCVATMSGAASYCVIAGTTISVDMKLRATGSKPLVLLASDTITVNATIDVASRRGTSPETGAGADPQAPSCAAGTAPGAGGGQGAGGAGGSFIGLGGSGGAGGNGGAGGVTGAVIATVNQLRGGCPGQDGQGGADGGPKGHGGGAVLLIAGIKISVNAVLISAAGEGGMGGAGNAAGAGGAGAGGMIAFDAPMFECSNSALLLATGGGGGQGGDFAAGASGSNGGDPSSTTAAPGGNLGSPRGGDGGAGATAPGTAAGAGGFGDNAGATRGGGGGGGGGAGLIKSFAISNFCTQLAPPAAP